MAVNSHSVDLELSSSQYLSITDGSQTGLDITGDFTIEAWIKMEQMPSTATTPFEILSKSLGASNQVSYSFYVALSGSDNFLACQYSKNGQSGSTNMSASNCDHRFSAGDVGKWIHVAVAVDVSATTFNFYVNGVLQTNTPYRTAATVVYDSSAAVEIGSSEGGTYGLFDGLIDGVRVWNDILTATEIQQNMWKQFDGAVAGCVGCWNLNNGYTDVSGNGNTLTANNSPTFSTDVPFIGIKPNGLDIATVAKVNGVDAYKLSKINGSR